MKFSFKSIYAILIVCGLIFISCSINEGPPGVAGTSGTNAKIYSSNWFSPTSWTGTNNAWSFNIMDTVISPLVYQSGLIMVYGQLVGYNNANALYLPLPCTVFNANWSYEINTYYNLEITSTLDSTPSITNSFRFVVIPPSDTTSITLEKGVSIQDIKKMSYLNVCKLLDLHE